MDVRTGKIVSEELLNSLPKSERKYFKPMGVAPTSRQMNRKPPKVSRNEPCPCGSGKKFKRCCLNAG